MLPNLSVYVLLQRMLPMPLLIALVKLVFTIPNPLLHINKIVQLHVYLKLGKILPKLELQHVLLVKVVRAGLVKLKLQDVLHVLLLMVVVSLVKLFVIFPLLINKLLMNVKQNVQQQ
jgi:hypothetical protein